jgi:predicted dinucleotide-binding enzyme
MKIGIIGSGDVARTLGDGLVAAGHDVMIGTRDVKRKELKSWHKKNDKHKSLGSTTEAASFAEVSILATAWHATEDILAQIRPELAGKVVIDVTNPIVFNDNEAPELTVGHSMSGGEIVQHSLPDSHVVKALNIINHAHMVNPKYKQGTPTMFICGNNQSAKAHTVEMLNDFGWDDIVDIGPIEKSRILEPLCLLWIEYGVSRGTWDHAISMIVT